MRMHQLIERECLDLLLFLLLPASVEAFQEDDLRVYRIRLSALLVLHRYLLYPLLAYVSGALSHPDYPRSLMAKPRTTTISADLGALKAPWLAWCQAQQLTPSIALRQILGRAIGGPSAQPSPSRAVLKHRREKAAQRIKLHLTPSELAGLKALASQEGYYPTQWVVAMIRTRLTRQPQVGQPELDRLTRSNQQLLALGRNLNQIAKVLHRAPQEQGAVRVALITELSRVIQAHTQTVSAVLRGSLERWPIR